MSPARHEAQVLVQDVVIPSTHPLAFWLGHVSQYQRAAVSLHRTREGGVYFRVKVTRKASS